MPVELRQHVVVVAAVVELQALPPRAMEWEERERLQAQLSEQHVGIDDRFGCAHARHRREPSTTSEHRGICAEWDPFAIESSDMT